MSNTFGRRFAVTTFGESHGPGVGAVVDGCPGGLPISAADIQRQLDRRRPGQSALTTSRREADVVEVLSGVESGLTLGTPIALLVRNTDVRPGDYGALARVPRPSHADYTYRAKYGVVASSGGGRASARETVGRVAAGAVAETFLRVAHGIEIVAWADAVGEVTAPPDLVKTPPTRDEVDAHPTRCPDAHTAAAMAETIAAAAADGDSVGGVVVCVCRGVPVGWGEPVFGKLHAVLAAAMLSIPAAKGFEIGAGFASARRRGSETNDLFRSGEAGRPDRLRTSTNRSGGVQGGISNGQPIVFRVAFKPPASIARAQDTVDYDGNPVRLETAGRHDPCVVARAVPVVEAMAALTLADAACLALEPIASSV
jgi:chorismate synthase